MKRSNVYYDTFKKVKENYKNHTDMIEVWEEKKLICLYNTAQDVGLFRDSDIIVAYDDDGKPVVVTERIMRSKTTWWKWIRLWRLLQHKSRVIKHELGYCIQISFGMDHIDYIHYKEEWWEWALKVKRQLQ